jgi:hypothetical protein
MHPLTVLLPLLLSQTPAFQTAAAQSRGASQCREWNECRRLALEAADRHEYETFHDFAWRTVQTGPKNNTDLMYLLARAQSLSGRPHDALVMIQRLTEMGVATDAATNDDFQRVRVLPGWPEVQALAERLGAPAAVASTSTASPRPASPATPAPNPAPPAPPAARANAATAAAAVAAIKPEPVEQAVRVSAPRFSASGLAYDSASGRFVVGDLHGRKLIVVEDGADHLVDLVRAESAGFRDIKAVEIDGRRGDLWVASATSEDREWSIHQLQLISGRPLKALPVDAALGPTRLVDLAISPVGAVVALDAAGRRLLEVRPRGTTLQTAMTLAVEMPTSVAAANDDGVFYVAGQDALVRVDLRNAASVPVSLPPGLQLGAIERLRWHKNTLLAVVGGGGSRRVVRFDLNASGRGVAAATVIDETITSGAGRVFATVTGDQLSYVVADPDTASAPQGSAPVRPDELVIRRIRLH